jgi:hypothetical protein
MTIVIPDGSDPWPWATRHYCRWTPAEELRLAEMVEDGMSVGQMARVLGRRPGAIVTRMGVLGLAWTNPDGHYTLNRVAEMLGVDIHTVIWWKEKRWLRARRSAVRKGRYHLQLVSHDDLVAFLGDERYWHLWEPERIADLALREWALEMRGHVRFLTTAEAGEILCMTHSGINVAIREGRLKAVKRGPNWLIRSDWLRLADPRPHIPGPRITDQEREYIRAWWGHKPAVVIGRELERSGTAVGIAARRMGLRPLERGYWRRTRAQHQQSIARLEVSSNGHTNSNEVMRGDGGGDAA